MTDQTSGASAFTLDQYVRFDLADTTIWSGTKRLKEEDFFLGDGGKLPPKLAASWGSKKVMDPERLKPFGAKKKAMERLLLENGVRWRSGVVVVPREKMDAVAKALDEIKNEANALVDQFIADYDQAKGAWLAEVALEDPKFAEVLEANMLSSAEVGGRIKFDWYVEGRDLPSHYQEKFDQRVATLGDRALEEIAIEANKAYDSISAKTEETLRRTSLGPVRRWRDKLRGLCLLDPSLAPMACHLDDLLNSAPPEGNIEGELYHRVSTLILVLCDPTKVRTWAVGKTRTVGIGSLFDNPAIGTVGQPDPDDFFDREDLLAVKDTAVTGDVDLFGDITFPVFDSVEINPVAAFAGQSSGMDAGSETDTSVLASKEAEGAAAHYVPDRTGQVLDAVEPAVAEAAVSQLEKGGGVTAVPNTHIPVVHRTGIAPTGLWV